MENNFVWMLCLDMADLLFRSIPLIYSSKNKEFSIKINFFKIPI
jgi:hypothetical protein